MYAGWARWGPLMGFVLSVAGEAWGQADGQSPALPIRGALEAPKVLASLDDVSEVCGALQLPIVDEHGQIDVPRAYREASGAVYQVRVGPRGFTLAPYRNPALALRLERGLAALGGGLSLAVLDRGPGRFMLGPSEAKAIAAAQAERKVALDVVFTVDHDAGEITPCFSLPHSEAASLRIRPIAYELIDIDNGTVMARTRTPEHARQLARRALGPADVSITVNHATGVRTIDAVQQVLQRRQDSFAGCLVKARPEDIVGLSADVAPAGGMSAVRVEIASMEDSRVAQCLERTLRRIVLPPSARPSRIGVVVEVVAKS